MLVLGPLEILLAMVLVAASLTVYAKYREAWDGIKRIDVARDLKSPLLPPVDPNALNILLIGSDSRAGVNGEIGGSAGISGARSDTDIVLHIAPGDRQIVVLSIPRDSVVPILNCAPEDGTPGQSAEPAPNVEQINATFAYGGPGCLWKTIEATTGIHLNDFVELTFIGFEKVIDALGGVNVCLPASVADPMSGLYLSAGLHHVYGKLALAFWRTREDLGEGDDPQRIQRDQFLMAALLQGIEHSGLMSSPAKMLSVIDAVTGHGYLATDTGLTSQRMLQIAEALHGISTESVQFVTAPWTLYSPNPDWVQWEQPQAGSLFAAIAHDTSLPRAAGSAPGGNGKTAVTPVPPAQVAVQVLNGSTVDGLAGRTITALQARGFDVIGQASNAATDTYTGSVIEYATAAQLPAAQTLAALVPHATIEQDASLGSAAVTLILGSTFSALKPASSAGAGGRGEGGTGSGGTGSGGTGISDLTGTYGGITGSVDICKDSSAFAGPDGD
jgi:LCP family protein required for cell wall assembly